MSKDELPGRRIAADRATPGCSPGGSCSQRPGCSARPGCRAGALSSGGGGDVAARRPAVRGSRRRHRATAASSYFDNWPEYIDPTEDGVVGTVDRFIEATGIDMNYTEAFNDNNEYFAQDPAGARHAAKRSTPTSSRRRSGWPAG